MRRKIIKILIVITFIVLIVSFSASTIGFRTEYKVKNTYRDISKEVKVITDKKTDSEMIKINFDKLKQINPDVIGWIEIPDTVIDYPVVASADNNYYLNHNFKKEYSQYGAVFTDCRLSAGNPFDYRNCIIYGHNMGRYTDVMFSSLMKYKSEDYFKAHQEVIIYTPEKETRYKIVSVREVNNDSYAYNVNFKNNKTFNKWIKKGVKDSIFDTETLENMENAVTLSTCTYGTKKLVLLCISLD